MQSPSLCQRQFSLHGTKFMLRLPKNDLQGYYVWLSRDYSVKFYPAGMLRHKYRTTAPALPCDQALCAAPCFLRRIQRTRFEEFVIRLAKIYLLRWDKLNKFRVMELRKIRLFIAEIGDDEPA